MSAMLVLQSEATFIADDKAEVFPDLCRDLSIYLSCISSGGLSFPTRERLCSMSGVSTLVGRSPFVNCGHRGDGRAGQGSQTRHKQHY